MKKCIAICSLLVALTMLTTGFGVVLRADDHPGSDNGQKTFTVDVALDAATLAVNTANPPTMGSRGDIIVINGTVYPAGTIPPGLNANNDPNAAGGIGKIRCRALELEPGTDFTTPVFTFVTEMYSLPDDNQIILVDGPGPNLFATVKRAIIGGTSSYDGVTGQVIETEIGVNKSGACNLRVTFQLRKQTNNP
jgi:hypothetical protein